MFSRRFPLLFCLVFVGNVISQTVQGTITDPLTGKGIPKLTVTIGDCTAVTDSVGHYIIHLKKATAVSPATGGLSNTPKVFQLYQNYPNPFNASTNLKYELPYASRVKITIYNIYGQQISSLVDEEKTAGAYQLNWSGTDFNGRPVTSGVYLVKFEADNLTFIKKLLLVR